MLLDQVGSILTASDAFDNDQFGWSVAAAANGTVLVVGAPYNDSGAVYTYDLVGTAWVQRGAILLPPSGTNYGASVSLSDDGTVLAVGQRFWSGAYANQGRVLLYDRSGDSWVQRASAITASDPGAGDYFGAAVRLSAGADTLVIGAPKWEGTRTDQGAVYTFDLVGGTWIERAKVTDAVAYIGEKLDLTPDGLVMCAGTTTGVLVYDRSGVDWVKRGDMIPLDGEGFHIVPAFANGGSILYAGVYFGETTALGGYIAVFDWSVGSWVQRPDIITSHDPSLYGQFGRSVDVSGSLLVVGTLNWGGATLANSGGVYSFSIVIPVTSVFWTGFVGQREEA